MADNDLNRFDEWFAEILANLDPAQRRKAALKLGQTLRRSNLKRMGANVQPDGSAMEPRKPRLDRRGKVRRLGKMFKGLRRLRNWKIDADADGVEIFPASRGVERVAAVSQFSEVDTVGRLRNGTPIRYRYPERLVIGFGPEDEHLALEIAKSMISPDD